MELKDIKNRKDVALLVETFYSKIRLDDKLGEFFNIMVENWDDHLERLTTFWESTLFFKTKYFGNPLEVHVNVDAHFNHSITQEHFGHWINLWIETVDALYEGENANKAKFRARKMSTFLYLKIFEARQLK